MDDEIVAAEIAKAAKTIRATLLALHGEEDRVEALRLVRVCPNCGSDEMTDEDEYLGPCSCMNDE
jgi:hypothetical protein